MRGYATSFLEARLSETELPRISVVGSLVSEKNPSQHLGERRRNRSCVARQMRLPSLYQRETSEKGGRSLRRRILNAPIRLVGQAPCE